MTKITCLTEKKKLIWVFGKRAFRMSFLNLKRQFEKANSMSFLEELFKELAFYLTTSAETANFTIQFSIKQLIQIANINS